MTRLIFNPALDGSGRRRGLSRAQYACVRRGDFCLLTGLPRRGLGRKCAWGEQGAEEGSFLRRLVLHVSSRCCSASSLLAGAGGRGGPGRQSALQLRQRLVFPAQVCFDQLQAGVQLHQHLVLADRETGRKGERTGLERSEGKKWGRWSYTSSVGVYIHSQVRLREHHQEEKFQKRAKL